MEEQQLEALKNRQDFLETEMAGLSRVISIMERTIASHEEVLARNGIGDLRVCVGELKILLYGDSKVGAPGLISQFKASENRIQQLVTQRDALKYVLIGVSIASIGQLGIVGAIAAKVFNMP